MAKPNPSFQKRMRERKKAEQRQEKARRKAERIADKGPTSPDEFTELKDALGMNDEEDEVAEESKDDDKPAPAGS